MFSPKRFVLALLALLCLMAGGAGRALAAPNPCTVVKDPNAGNDPQRKFVAQSYIRLPKSTHGWFYTELPAGATTLKTDFDLYVYVAPMRNAQGVNVPGTPPTTTKVVMDGLTEPNVTVPITVVARYGTLGSYVHMRGSFDLLDMERRTTQLDIAQRREWYWQRLMTPCWFAGNAVYQNTDPAIVTDLTRNGRTFCQSRRPTFEVSPNKFARRNTDFDKVLTEIKANRCPADIMTQTPNSNPSDPFIWTMSPDFDGDGLVVERELTGFRVGTPPTDLPCAVIAARPGESEEQKIVRLSAENCVQVEGDAGYIVRLDTNPFIKDTDGDGLHDGSERAISVLVSGRRVTSDPQRPDSDGDGRIDGAELCLTLQGQPMPPVGDRPCEVTSPLLTDSDGDRKLDGVDTCHLIYSGTAPNRFPVKVPANFNGADDDCNDDDGDGLKAVVERLAKTSDSKVDSDHDGKKDGLDTDMDGITDDQEFVKVNDDYTIGSRTSLQGPDAYVLLLYAGHPSLDTAAVGAKIEAYFAALDAVPFVDRTGRAQSEKLKVHVVFQQVPAAAQAEFLDRCYVTLENEGSIPSAEDGWLSREAPANYGAGAAVFEGLPIWSVAHVGRLCFDDDRAYPVRGLVKHLGSWQFMAKMRAPVANTPLAQWNHALASLVTHQLGHSLGLGHSGDGADDCNPVYPSIMNHGYDFQPLGDADCSTRGFSKGNLARPTNVGELVELRAQASEEVCLEHDALGQGRSKTGAELLEADLDFLKCWAAGDRRDRNGDDVDDEPMRHPAVVKCGTGALNRQLYCVNWDQDDVNGALDGVYTTTSLRDARTGMGAGETNFVSGCKLDSEIELDRPDMVLKDHDDAARMVQKLASTLKHDDLDCAFEADDAQSCRIKEPASAFTVDWFPALWP